MNIALLIIFSISCAIVTVFFAKKKIDFARSAFLAVGMYIGCCFLFLLCVDSVLELETVEFFRLDIIYTYLMPISTLIYGATAIVIIIATVILSIFAINKIVEYFGSNYPKKVCENSQNINTKQHISPRHKIFVLFCRWIN